MFVPLLLLFSHLTGLRPALCIKLLKCHAMIYDYDFLFVVFFFLGKMAVLVLQLRENS